MGVVRKNKIELFTIVNICLLICIIFVMLYPLIYIVSISISDIEAVGEGKVGAIPKGFDLTGFSILFKASDLPRGYRNTIIYTALGTVLGLIFTSLAAYPLSRKRLLGRKFWNFAFVVPLFLYAGFLPNYLVIQWLGLLDTIWGVVLIPALNSWYIIILRTSFSGIPKSLEESAFLDGANDWIILFRIIIPLSKSVFAVIGLFVAVVQWNNYIFPLLFLNDPELFPLTLILKKYLVDNAVFQGDLKNMVINSDVSHSVGLGEKIKAASIIITILPIAMLYPFIQKYFVKGLLIGSVKG